MIIDEYLDIAKSRNGIKSDRQLSEYINMSRSAVTMWRTRRAWPTPEAMVNVAELADVEPEKALLDLGQWQASTPKVKSVYSRIAERLEAAPTLTFFKE